MPALAAGAGLAPSSPRSARSMRVRTAVEHKDACSPGRCVGTGRAGAGQARGGRGAVWDRIGPVRPRPI